MTFLTVHRGNVLNVGTKKMSQDTFNADQKFDLPYLYRKAKEVDKDKALEIGAAYVKLEIDFKEACEQFREIINET